MPDHLHLAVALDGAGWHPAAWRLPESRAEELTTAGYWTDLVRTAESGLLDFVTIEDALSLQSSDRTGPDQRTDEVRGRLDAVLIASRVAPLTRHIGFVPTATVTHTEPFHVSKALATLDFVATGRAGWRVKVSGRADEAEHFGRRPPPQIDRQADIEDLFAEAGDFVEIVRRLWDSWEDDAEIRDIATGRFIDRERLHYIDFESDRFSIKGPSITPRPPQGQPLVTALAHAELPRRFAAQHADIAYVTPFTQDEAVSNVAEIREVAAQSRRDVKIFGDLVVLLDQDADRARHRLARLDGWSGRPFSIGTDIFVGTPVELADRLLALQLAGLDGFRLRPAALPYDLNAIVEQLVPELQRRDAFRTAYASDTLRGNLGLTRPANRYVTDPYATEGRS